MPKKYKNDELEEKETGNTPEDFSEDVDDDDLFDDGDLAFGPFDE